MKKSTGFMKLLLGTGADPNIKNRVTGMLLLHATTRSGNFELLEILLKKEEINISIKDYKDRTILHLLAQVREKKPGDKYILQNCVKVLLDNHSVTKVGIDFGDISVNTALYIALENGFRDRAKLLLNKGADISVLENGSQVLLPTILPILEENLENSLMGNDVPVNSKYLHLKLNFQLLKNIFPHIAET